MSITRSSRERPMTIPTSGPTAGPRSWERAAARLFAFSCFFPYPAVALGENTGLQLSQALALAGVPLLSLRAPGRALFALVALLAPIYLSAFLVLLGGEVPSPSVLPKEAIALTLALLVLWPSEWACRGERMRDLLAAAVAALGVHALIGLLQVYAFSYGEFPLLALYRNPSCKSMQEWSPIYARYIQRPCGLFPEPSAMAASLGPWLVLLSGLVADPIRARALGWSPGTPTILALAGGFGLLALSRSGAVFPMMALLLVYCGARLPDWLRTARGATPLAIALVLAACLGSIGYGALKLSGGLQGRVDSSWGLRALSIQTGLSASTDPLGLAVGVGPGQSTPVLRRQLAWVPLPEDQDELAVFSLAVCYYMETGLIGLAALGAVLALALRAVLGSSAVLLGLCVLGAWLVGVVATTSYMPLSAIWLMLGVLLAWDSLFPTPALEADPR